MKPGDLEILVTPIVYLVLTYYLVKREVSQKFKEFHIKIDELDKRIDSRIHNNQMHIGRVEALNDVRYTTLLGTKTISKSTLSPEEYNNEQ
jgi:predicted HAD superfamily Cof-like phosphohydrolase